MICGTVLCLGDSLTDGARAPSGLGYPEVLVDLLNERSHATQWACLNRGISGQVTWEILRRTPGAVRELAGLFGAKACVILTGTNDSKGGGDGEKGLVRWEKLYRQIVHWPLRYGIPTWLCTFPAVSREMPEFTEASEAWLSAASMAVRKVRNDFDGTAGPDGRPVGVGLVELNGVIGLKNLVDGVHLTATGYELLACAVAREMIPWTKP